MRILFTGGGTGGHIFPIIAVARELKKIYTQGDLEMLFLGPGNFTEALEKEGIKVKIISAGKLRRYPSGKTILDFFKFPLSLCQAFLHVYIWMPDIIFSKGGYGSVPVVIVGWLYRIPILIHESDTIPGLANRLGAKLSRRIAISFTSAKRHFPPHKTALLGSPVRQEVIQVCLSATEEEKEKARNIFKITSQKPVIFIAGGSQGARTINKIVSTTLSRLLEKYEIIHQCGSKNYQKILDDFNKSLPADYHLYPFLEENQLGLAYLAADLVISRAGAGSVFEIAACGRPSILVPLVRAASGHQRGNAFAYAKAGATIVLEETNLMPHLFINRIAKILDNPELAQKMSANAKSFFLPEAANKVAQALIEIGK